MNRCYFLYMILTALSLWYLLNFFFGERIQASSGLGYDGALYARFAENFWQMLHGRQIDYYFIQRIFPSFAVHSIATLLNYSLASPSNMIRSFYFWDVVMVFVGMYGFYRIIKLQKWNFNIALLGFSALLLNFPMMKLISYSPVLTDYTAFALGIYMLYFYLRNNLYGLIVVTLLGAFTFPTMLLIGTLFIIFPRKSAEKFKEKYLVELSLTLNYSFLVGIFIAGLMLFIALYLSAYVVPLAKLKQPLTVVSSVALFLYFLAMILPFVRTQIIISVKKWRLCLGVSFFCLVHYIEIFLSSKQAITFTMMDFLERNSSVAIIYPFVFLVTHFAYYGPLVLLMIVYWKKLVACADEYGSGLFLVLLMYAFLLLDSESRQLINILPVFVFLLCESLKESHISQRFAYGMIGLSLIISKAWLPINIWQWPSIFGSSKSAFSEFPYQMLFMNIGPWLGWKMYVVELIVMLIIFFGLRQTRQPFLAGFRKFFYSLKIIS